MARANDGEILAFAIEKKMIVITLDGHFGDWAVLPLRHHAGVVRVKANPTTTLNILVTLLPFLRKNVDASFEDSLVIVSERGIRWIHTGDM